MTREYCDACGAEIKRDVPHVYAEGFSSHLDVCDICYTTWAGICQDFFRRKVNAAKKTK
jgi:ribosome-binding protein aMBF1 (putative translation factor)